MQDLPFHVSEKSLAESAASQRPPDADRLRDGLLVLERWVDLRARLELSYDSYRPRREERAHLHDVQRDEQARLGDRFVDEVPFAKGQTAANGSAG